MEAITLINNEGRKIQIPANTTIDELVTQFGCDGIALLSDKQPEPLPDNWWKAEDQSHD